jgi:hypothetical protein
VIAEVKLWTLAQLDATLRTFFGTGPFRWCDIQLTQNYLPKQRGQSAPGGGSSSVVVRRVSSIPQYMQSGLGTIERIRFQCDVLDLDPNVATNAALALIAWFQTVNLVTGQQFGSPVTTPNQFPSFYVNLRRGLWPQAGAVVYADSVDVMLYNNTAN